MPSRIFRVDLSDAARDFQHTATEPGLGMLDESGANYAVLKQWIGDYAAEPNWERPGLVAFHVRREGERLAEYQAASVSGDDLEKPLKEEFEELQNKLRRARPDTAAEQSLHRVASIALKNLGNDPDAHDCGCFLFKYRVGKEPWRLVWCWGFQRIDMQPSKPLVCEDPDCHQLFVRRAGEKAICPGCAAIVRRVPGPVGAGGVLRRVGMGGLLLLILLLLLMMFGQPKLVATPNTWSGPEGSTVDFNIISQRFFIFKKDVTQEVFPLSHDKRVMDFPRGPQAKATGVGQTLVTFRHGDRVTDVVIRVGPAKPPTSIEIEPASVLLGIGTTAPLKVTGITADGDRVDMTENENIEFVLADEKVALVHDEHVEGAKVGKTVLTAMYKGDPFADPIEASSEVEVKDFKFATLEVGIEPSKLKRGQKAELDFNAISEDGNKFSVNRSTLLNLIVAPPEVAELETEEELLRGVQTGAGELKAEFTELASSGAFTVGELSVVPAGTFEVTPEEVDLVVYEYFRLNVISDTTETITGTSSDPKVVEVLDDQYVVGRGVGTTMVTLNQGGKSQMVKINVKGTDLVEMWADSDRIILKPGQRRLVRILARTADGREIELDPTQITWEAQPLAEYVDFNRTTLYLTGIAPTPRAQRLAGRVGEALLADTLVEVVGDPSASMLVVGEDPDFTPYPPLTRYDINAGGFVGRGLVFRGGMPVVMDNLPADHILVRSGFKPGTVISGINDQSFKGWTTEQIRQYFLDHPLDKDDIVMATGTDGVLSRLAPGEMGQLIEPVKIFNATYHAQGGGILAKLRLEVTESGFYRVIVPGVPPKETWVRCEKGISETIITDSFAKPTSTDPNKPRDFDLIVERKIGEDIKRFSKNLTLPADSEIK